MRYMMLSLSAAASLALASGMALAGNGNGKDKGHGKIAQPHNQVYQTAGAKDCPPGLAKKQNGCNPPGLVKHRYRVGDRIDDDYIVIRRPGRYGLDPDESYYRVGDYVYRVDRDTREVLDLIGAVTAILN